MSSSSNQQSNVVTVDMDWQSPPHNRWAFQHISNLLPTAQISRGSGAVALIPRSPVDLYGLDVPDAEGNRLTLADWMTQTCTDSLVVLQDGALVWESYFHDMTASTPHLLMSVSKTFTAMLAGILVDLGLLDRQATGAHYVPELATSSYGDATVQQILDMQVGVAFSEDYLDPQSEAQQLERAAGWRPLQPGEQPGMHAILAGLQKQGDHGERFHYTSATTDVLGWIIKRAGGEPFAALFSRHIWSRLGAANDAYVTVDHYSTPLVDGGICASPHDLARFGQMLISDGQANGQQIVPAWWIADTRRNGSNAAWRRSSSPARHAWPSGAYRNCTWISGDDHGTFYGSGIYGQTLWIDPAARVVIAKFSSWPAPLDAQTVKLQRAGLQAIVRALHGH